MTEPDDPTRLTDPSAPAGLRDVLRAAQNDVGSDAQLARLSQRLGPLLGPAVPAAPAAAGLSAAKLGLAGLALLAAGGGAWLLTSNHASAPRPAQPAQSVAVASPPRPVVVTPSAEVAAPEPATPEPAAPEPATPASPPAATPEPKPAVAATPKQVEKPTPPAQLSEAELLEQARAALKSDPARALQRANEHAARFPGGVLVQEREVIAIQALRQLGRDAEADRRAQAFAKAFPGSAFARKLNANP